MSSMKNRPQKYRRMSEIEAFLMDEVNGEEVAEWCNGRYVREAKASDTTDISQRVKIPTFTSDEQAAVLTVFPGQYVVKLKGGGFEVWHQPKFAEEGYEPFYHRTNRSSEK